MNVFSSLQKAYLGWFVAWPTKVSSFKEHRNAKKACMNGRCYCCFSLILLKSNLFIDPQMQERKNVLLLHFVITRTYTHWTPTHIKVANTIQRNFCNLIRSWIIFWQSKSHLITNVLSLKFDLFVGCIFVRFFDVGISVS